MQTCESCGASFEPQTSLEEVTSLRILCPSCARARAEAKARKAQAAAAPRPPAAKSPAPSRAPSPAMSAPSVPAPASPARSASGRGPAPAPSAKGPAPAASGKPAREKENPARAKPAQAPHHEVDHEELRRRQKQKGMREVWLSLIGVVVIGGITWIVYTNVSKQKKAVSDAEAAWVAKVENFKTTFGGMSIESKEGAEALIAYSEANRDVWADDALLAPDIISRTAKAKSFIDALEERGSLDARLTEIEAGLAAGPTAQPSQIAEQRRRLEEIAPRAEAIGSDLAQRVVAGRKQAESLYLERLVAVAEEAGQQATLDRAALTVIQQSEDEVFKLFNAVALQRQKNPGDAELKAQADLYEDKYRKLISLADDSVERFFTAEVIGQTSWRDLLADDQKSQWKGPALKGFEHRIDGGTLHMLGPDPSEKSEGILSIGDKEVWRDYVLEAEFTIDKGSPTLWFRLPVSWQGNELNELLSTDEGALEAGRTYVYEYTLLGSTMSIEEKSEGGEGRADRFAVSWVKPRKGAFAISVPKDTEVRFTRLRLKLLR